MVIIIFYANICLAEIITTNNFKVIEDHVESADNNTLVIFDIDDVLLQPKDCSLRNYYENDDEQQKAKDFFKKIYSQLTTEQQSEMFMQMQFEPTDIKMIKLINTMQKRAVKVLALTARWTGIFGKIPSMENFTIQQLKHFGYNFASSWPNLNDLTFDQISTRVPKQFPGFTQGVLLTDGVPKGNVLEAFLNYIRLRPQKIIFIDDHKRNIESVASFAAKNNFNFLGIEYTIVKHSNKQLFNRMRSNFQFDTLKKDHKWLSDQEADKILHRKKTELIKILTTEIHLEQKQFPQGDHKDLDYVKKIINIMYLLDQKVRVAFYYSC